MIRFTCLLLACFGPFLLSAQCCGLRVSADSLVPASVLNKWRSRLPSRMDSLTAWQMLGTLQQDLLSRGHAGASVDSFSREEEDWVARVYAGPTYTWLTLRVDSTAAFWLRKWDLPGNWQGREYRFKTRQWAYIREDLLDKADEKGYPFLSFTLANLSEKQDTLLADWVIRPGLPILVDRLFVPQDIRIRNTFLQRYLEIRTSEPYKESSILKSRERLDNLPFLQVTAPTQVAFHPGKADVYLNLRKKTANRFDILIGLLQGNVNAPGQQNRPRYVITGNAELELHNQFGLAERLFAQFRQVRVGTQQLQVQAVFPYLASLPLGLNGRFELYKRDSQFLELKYQGGLEYMVNGSQSFNAFVQVHQNNLLTLDTTVIRTSGKLPSSLDFTIRRYGLEARFLFLDYRFNPRKGWSVQGNFSFGDRRIRKNDQILALNREGNDFDSLYTALGLRQNQWRTQWRLEYFLPTGRYLTLRTQLQAGGVWSNDKKILDNELFRLGGNQSLRGFDEEFFLAGRYAILTAEFRLLSGRNSNFFLFGEAGWFDAVPTVGTLGARGFGAGMQIDTQAGIFALSYALGSGGDQKINLRNGKIHFGYLSLF